SEAETEDRVMHQTIRDMPEVADIENAGGDPGKIRIAARDVSVFYGEKQALFGVDLDIEKNQVTSLIGPSGCGKSTFLRSLNRMNDTIDICRVEGQITLDGLDIYDRSIDVVELRARIGM